MALELSTERDSTSYFSPALEFYQLKRNPFTKAPDPDHIHHSFRIEEALARLEHAVLAREIALITGEIGVGKTTVSRAFVDRLSPERFLVVWIVHPRLSPTQFLQLLASRLMISPVPVQKANLIDRIYERIYDLWTKRVTPVILVDEAQLLPSDTLEELRLLSNFQGDEENLFSLILVGQPELKRRLEQPRFQALAQRIGIRYHISALELAEVNDYIYSRVRSSGRESPLFTPEAVEAIARFSRGVPRVINHLCANLLLYGYLKEEDPIGEESVHHIAKELGLS